MLPVSLLVMTTILSAAVGSIPMTFFGVALFERLMDLPSIGIQAAPLLGVYGLGLVLGNIRPLVWSETVRDNLSTVVSVSAMCIDWIGMGRVNRIREA